MDADGEGGLVMVVSERSLAREVGAGDGFWVLRFAVRAGAGVGAGEGVVVAGISSKVSPHATSIVGSGKPL
jgi:hypothetical protein